MTLLALRPILCVACQSVIAETDGESIITSRRAGDHRAVRQRFYGTRAELECHREIRQGSRYVVCRTLNVVEVVS